MANDTGTLLDHITTLQEQLVASKFSLARLRRQTLLVSSSTPPPTLEALELLRGERAELQLVTQNLSTTHAKHALVLATALASHIQPPSSSALLDHLGQLWTVEGDNLAEEVNELESRLQRYTDLLDEVVPPPEAVLKTTVDSPQVDGMLFRAVWQEYQQLVQEEREIGQDLKRLQRPGRV